VKCIDFSPHSNDFIVTAGDGSMRHIDGGSGKTLFQIAAGETLNAVRTDGFTVLAVGEQGIVRGWNLRGAEELVQIPTGAGQQNSLAVSEDGTTFCVANQKAFVFQQKR
jgi:WD40 repeat protein